jgi:hypothetical protein
MDNREEKSAMRNAVRSSKCLNFKNFDRLLCFGHVVVFSLSLRSFKVMLWYAFALAQELVN